MATVVVALSSCAEEEQNRVLSYDKGTYLGKQDQSLSSDQLRELMMRSHIQRVY
jgi:RAB protein geranylgeranyltransferase component A